MKKILLASLLLSATLLVSAQPSFTAQGPKTINDLEAKNTNEHYTFFKFSHNSVVAFADSNSGNWDIAFKGTTILLNGGSSGPSTVAGQVVSGGSFTTTDELPVTGYNTDNATTKAIPTGSGNGWYTYNPSLHLITPTADRVIAIQLANGDYVKLEILSYYQGAPQSPDYMTSVAGVYSFRYQISSANDFSSMNTRITNLRANMTDYQYFNLSEGDTLLTSEASGTGWDIAFKNTTILVNSGTSGSSTVSAQVVSADYDTYFTAPSSGYNVDGTPKAIPTGSDNGWYNYNSTTHQITAIPNKTIVIKTASGKYVKLKVESYYKDANTSGTGAYYSFSYFYQPYFSDDLKTDASNTTTGVLGTSTAEVVVYPQPLTADAQMLRVEGHDAAKADVIIYNTMGEVVYTTQMSDGVVEVNGWNKKPGCYVLKCTNGELVSSQRIVVQ